jgi:hypothetical protein
MERTEQKERKLFQFFSMGGGWKSYESKFCDFVYSAIFESVSALVDMKNMRVWKGREQRIIGCWEGKDGWLWWGGVEENSSYLRLQ